MDKTTATEGQNNIHFSTSKILTKQELQEDIWSLSATIAEEDTYMFAIKLHEPIQAFKKNSSQKTDYVGSPKRRWSLRLFN